MTCTLDGGRAHPYSDAVNPMPSPAAALTALARLGVDAAADRRTKQGYLRWLPAAGAVLDVGCGAGAFLDVAKAASLMPVGIDLDVKLARQRGHDVHEGDAIAVLGELTQRGKVFAGAVLAHVIEHVDGEGAITLLRAIAAVLPPGAPLVLVTPNSRNYIVLSELFWLDPTHVRPYPRRLLERIGEACGFDMVASYDDPSTRPYRSWPRALVARLRSLLSGVDKSGALDAVVVLRRR
ncbi:MAG: SAM-dependent methyltransferase [Hyphomicrobiaceae bacterium]|jgi:SAM-dependent methyltransferase